MAMELLGPVDWDAWRRTAEEGKPKTKVPTIPAAKASLVTAIHGVVVGGKVHEVTEAERVALLVLSLGRQRDDMSKSQTKAANKAIRIALRDIEQAVIMCEQEIDYL